MEKRVANINGNLESTGCPATQSKPCYSVDEYPVKAAHLILIELSYMGNTPPRGRITVGTQLIHPTRKEIFYFTLISVLGAVTSVAYEIFERRGPLDNRLDRN
jgi:hypothetical protein